MDRQVLTDQMDFLATSIEEVETKIKDTDPSDKSYLQLLEAHNKLLDLYEALYNKLEDVDKFDLECEKLNFEKERFKYQTEHDSKREKKEDIQKWVELALKIGVPVVVGLIMFGIAKMSYLQDNEMKLRNGNVFGLVKDVAKLAVMKV